MMNSIAHTDIMKPDNLKYTTVHIPSFNTLTFNSSLFQYCSIIRYRQCLQKAIQMLLNLLLQSISPSYLYRTYKKKQSLYLVLLFFSAVCTILQKFSTNTVMQGE
jgi:hypothetical protein